MDPPSEPPKTPPNKFPLPPTPREKTPPPRISFDINQRDPQGPLYFECLNEDPDFEVPPLKEGDFKERLTPEEWADKLGYKLSSGASLFSRRPDLSELGSGAKLPPSIEEIDRLLKKGDEDPIYMSERFLTSEPTSRPAAFLGPVRDSQKADPKDPKLSSDESSEVKVALGLMLPPPPKEPRGLQKKPDKHILKPPPEEPSIAKQGKGAMPQRLLKDAARLQEMADIANPVQAEEHRAKVFMHGLPHAQAASRRLQGHLGIYSDETWPLPPLPSDNNPFIIEINAMIIRTALEDCKDFAVTTDRNSAKLEFLDVAAKHAKKRVVMRAGQAPQLRVTAFKKEKKAKEAEEPIAISRTVDEGLQEDPKGLEHEGISELLSTPKPVSNSVGPSSSPTAPQMSEESNTAAIMAAASQDEELPPTSQAGSSVETAERERRKEKEKFTRDPHLIGIGPYGWPRYAGAATPDSADGPDATGTTPEEAHRANVAPNPRYGFEGSSMTYDTPTASTDDREMRATSYETKTAEAAFGHTLAADAPPQKIKSFSIHDSDIEGTSSIIGEGRETSSRVAVAILAGPRAQDEGKGQERNSSARDRSMYASHTQDKKKREQTISDVRDAYMDDGQQHHGKMVDVAASLRNHWVTFVDETQPKTKERNPPVPQPQNMPNTLTEAICNHIPLEAKPILTLTLERVDSPVPFPTDQRCILLKHFEVGLDGVEGLCQGTAKIPENSAMTAERERRVGKIGTFKDGDGGFYRALKSAQQKEQQYGKGYWYFFGVKFKQTSKERKLRRGGKWLLFGAPIEAVHHLDIKKSQENVLVFLGGGVDKSGTTIKPFKANFKRTHTLFSRGGVAPMDIWQGGEDWDDGVFKEIRAAMANNGLRVGFLYGDSQTFSPIPMSFPTTGKSEAEKKRKQSGPDMTEEETKAMEKSMKPKKLSDEDIGTILAMKVIKDRAKQDAAARSK